MLQNMCPEKDLTNEDRLWFLNICFAEYYAHGLQIKRNMLEEMRQASFQLAKLGERSFFILSFYVYFSISDNDTQEYFFCYICLHWPNEVREDAQADTQYLPTYDEEILCRYIG